MFFIKNTTNELIIEPYFNVDLQPGETKEVEDNVAQRLLVLRPRDVILVDSMEEKAPEKVEPVIPPTQPEEQTQTDTQTQE